MKRTQTNKPLSVQMKRNVADSKKPKEKEELDGNTEVMISTGSTLLDLCLTGGRKRGGGIPGGVYVEVSGPESSGKTVLLSEVAGAIQRQGGEVTFKDPEGSLDSAFAKIFDMTIDEDNYSQPDVVSKVFKEIANWKPKNPDVINGIFVDSLAALSTELEMENEEGDKMGMRRAKEFSEGFRKTCRTIANKNWIMMASNQIREKTDAVSFGKKTDTPGGKALKFYATIRIEFSNVRKIIQVEKVRGIEVKKTIGVEVDAEIIKNKTWKPFGKTSIVIIFDYGIDDIRTNLQYVKKYKKLTSYCVGGVSLGTSLEEAIRKVENQRLTKQLRNEVIDLWEEIEALFESDRRKKERD